LAISESLEASLQIGSAVLITMGMFEDHAHSIVDSFRKECYG
jgi:hypothetical protein